MRANPRTIEKKIKEPIIVTTHNYSRGIFLNLIYNPNIFSESNFIVTCWLNPSRKNLPSKKNPRIYGPYKTKESACMAFNLIIDILDACQPLPETDDPALVSA